MRFLRGVVISAGLSVLGLFGLVELVLRRRSGRPPAPFDAGADVDLVTGTADPQVSRAVSRTRLLFGALGAGLALYGVYVVVRTIPWTSYLAIAIWLAAAVVLHDAVVVPAVSVLRAATLRVGRRLSAASLALIEGAFVVGGVLSLIALPEIWAKHRGTLNPTVLPGAYGRALVLTWLVLAIVAVAVVAVLDHRQRVATARAGQM